MTIGLLAVHGKRESAPSKELKCIELVIGWLSNQSLIQCIPCSTNQEWPEIICGP